MLVLGMQAGSQVSFRCDAVSQNALTLFALLRMFRLVLSPRATSPPPHSSTYPARPHPIPDPDPHFMIVGTSFMEYFRLLMSFPKILASLLFSL